MTNRRTTRDFLPDMPEREKIEKIIEAGTYAPTGRNKQSPIIISVTNRKMRDKLSEMNSKIMGKGIR